MTNPYAGKHLALVLLDDLDRLPPYPLAATTRPLADLAVDDKARQALLSELWLNLEKATRGTQ